MKSYEIKTLQEYLSCRALCDYIQWLLDSRCLAKPFTWNGEQIPVFKELAPWQKWGTKREEQCPLIESGTAQLQEGEAAAAEQVATLDNWRRVSYSVVSVSLPKQQAMPKTKEGDHFREKLQETHGPLRLAWLGHGTHNIGGHKGERQVRAYVNSVGKSRQREGIGCWWKSKNCALAMLYSDWQMKVLRGH